MNTSTAKGGGMSETPRTDAELMGPATPFPGLDDCMQTVPASVARQLERELTEARAQNAKLVSDIYAHEHINTQMIFEKRKLECELKEARADKERLDWLQSEHERIDPIAALVVKREMRRDFGQWANIVGHNVRAAIDAARKEQA